VSADLLHIAGNITAALILTYAVSRAGLFIAKGMKHGNLRLAVVHIASWILLTVVVGWIEWYSASAGWIYVLPQCFWFAIDKLRARGA
jgi:hypothetical protein